MPAAEGPSEPVDTVVVRGTDAAETAVETIHRELTVFARRARASAGRMHPELSLVSYTLLGHLEESGAAGPPIWPSTMCWTSPRSAVR